MAGIQRRWGVRAIRRLKGAQMALPAISTRFPQLDQALGIGGIPRGRLTEIIGLPTSGMGTLALQWVAAAQAEGDQAAYIDLDQVFDPAYAVQCGVDLSHLLLVRPHAGSEALDIASALVADQGAGILVFDSVSHLLGESQGAQVLSTGLRCLAGALERSPCAFIFLTPLPFGQERAASYPSGLALPHYAAIRLLLAKERWLYRRRDIRGYQVQVTVLKNKLGPAGKQLTIRILFP